MKAVEGLAIKCVWSHGGGGGSARIILVLRGKLTDSVRTTLTLLLFHSDHSLSINVDFT